MELQNKIAKINKEIRNAENARLQAQTRLDSLEEQYREINDEFKTLGIEPKNAVKAKEEMEKEMSKMEQEINKLLPHDSIKNYK